KAFRAGEITTEQAGTIIEKLSKSPLMPSLIVTAVDKRYFAFSKLSDEEKADGRKTLKRFARGMIDKKIDKKGIDAVMAHVADRQENNQWQPRQRVSDDDLRAALKEAKSQADAANIPDEPENFDPAEVVKKIIDESLDQH